MTKKVFRSIFIVTMVTVITSFAFIMWVLYGYFSDVQKKQLREEALFVAQGVNLGGEQFFENLVTDEYRLTWIEADGTVLYDTDASASGMENHSDRKEIQEALKTGVGESERYSATLSEKTIYYAKQLQDGTVIRVSVTQYSILSLIYGMIQPICIILGLTLVLSLILADRISQRVVAPLNRLDLDNPLENDTYEEIAPLLRRIDRQHKEIDSQLETLKQKQEEFDAVTGSMSEGLLLINKKGQILSINHAAEEIFHTDSSCVRKDLLSVERNVSIQKIVEDAGNGQHGEVIFSRDGMQYQVDASPVMLNQTVTGVAILIFDITEKSTSERQRREFTANVSHELKTPLQSIMGSAELLENGLVKPEDVPHFVGRIRTESQRLVTLIEDIIKLSQLDEGGNMPYEEVPVLELAREVSDSLKTQAEQKNITVKVEGTEQTVIGVKRLLHETIFNLCDNSIKYTNEGGTVTISVSGKGTGVQIAVSDNGIGIPPEHHDRIFERFYRVDKSHSKETGGTGLGLSIVKHAVSCHHGSIHVDSEVGKGTTITVYIPTDCR